MTVRASCGSVCVLAWLVLAGAAPAHADPVTVGNLPEVSAADLAESVVAIDHAVSEIDSSVSDIDIAGSLDDAVATDTSQEQTVVTIASDILFDYGSAELTSLAQKALAEVAADIPQAGQVQIDGYTDAKGSEASNLALSNNRAEAVAKVIAEDRPDVKINPEGHGEADPVEPNTKNGEDNPEGRAKNRRVEIAYAP